jgi:hypothetical protein
VRPVGPERNGVEIWRYGQATTVRPEPVEGLPFVCRARRKNSASTSSARAVRA